MRNNLIFAMVFADNLVLSLLSQKDLKGELKF